MPQIPEPKKVAAIRKYPFEYAVAALIAAVVYLFSLYVGMNDKLNGILMQQLKETTSVIEKNTMVIQQHIK